MYDRFATSVESTRTAPFTSPCCEDGSAMNSSCTGPGLVTSQAALASTARAAAASTPGRLRRSLVMDVLLGVIMVGGLRT